MSLPIIESMDLDISGEAEENLENLDENIVSLISKEVTDRKELPGVSKSFYAACCALEANHYSLVIDDVGILADTEIVNSIVTSQRELNKICITVNIFSKMQLEQLRTIFQRFGLKTNQLLWEKCFLSLSQYGAFLNLSPNLKELSIRKWHLTNEATDRNLSPFNLAKLQKLVVIDCDFRMELLLHKFPQDVLLEVVFKENRFRNLHDFFFRQQNIKKLKMHKKFALLQQKLTHLSFEPWDEDDVIELIRGQNELVFLEVARSYRLIDKEERMSAIFEAACGLQSLQVLKIDIEFVRADKIESIFHLYNLNDLQLSSELDGIDSVKKKELDLIKKLKVFVSGQLPNLTKLSLHFPSAIVSDQLIKSIGKRFSTVKSFEITAKFFDLSAILHSFVELTSLNATYKSDDDKLLLNYFSFQFVTVRYRNLKHLSLNISEGRAPCFISADNFINLLSLIPEVQTLQVTVNFQIKTSLIEDIFKTLPHLTSLSLTQDWNEKRKRIKITIEFMMIIFHQKNLLKFSIEDEARELDYQEKDLINIFRHRYQNIVCEKRRIVVEKRSTKATSFTQAYFE